MESSGCEAVRILRCSQDVIFSPAKHWTLHKRVKRMNAGQSAHRKISTDGFSKS